MAASQFEGLLTTLSGYVIIAAFLVLLYYVFSALQLHRIKRVFGFCYVVVKVGWLVGRLVVWSFGWRQPPAQL